MASGSAAGSPRVMRGGCWHDPPGLLRSAARLKALPHEGEDCYGFRVALASLELATGWRTLIPERSIDIG
jgi:formylglycine-generating enzyme required for sulfatase activity